jgi:hypothetical protein
VLDHLRERNCVAATARSLIFYRAEEVIAADISPIEIVRNLVVRDFRRSLVLFLESLGLL